ncbi:hypothetical protein FHX68_0865 [Microbacterium lacticum]|uniref:Uncharacterized protein n=1 Tax=Microbacterium lacticum TaxID=33885 RepID=A0A543L0B1_9MICO|nr:hypothetical protein FHX68_0865 [Microbacterium lacticum]
MVPISVPHFRYSPLQNEGNNGKKKPREQTYFHHLRQFSSTREAEMSRRSRRRTRNLHPVWLTLARPCDLTSGEAQS